MSEVATEFYSPSNANMTGYDREAVFQIAALAAELGCLVHISGLPFGRHMDTEAQNAQRRIESVPARSNVIDTMSDEEWPEGQANGHDGAGVHRSAYAEAMARLSGRRGLRHAMSEENRHRVATFDGLVVAGGDAGKDT